MIAAATTTTKEQQGGQQLERLEEAFGPTGFEGKVLC